MFNIKALQSYFDELTEEIDNNNYRVLDYIKSIDNCVDSYDFLVEYNNTNTLINDIVLEMIKLFEQGRVNKTTVNKNCEFQGHCNKCTSLVNDYEYCYSDCVDCKYYRKHKQNEHQENLKKYYDTHITSKFKTSTNNSNVYIKTKDRFFYVTITTDKENANEQLRYIFTYLMCGASGKLLFPNENKHSNAQSYVIRAAKYFIQQANENSPKSILHGVLRYKYSNTSSMNNKRLEKMGDENYIVKASMPMSYSKSAVLKDEIAMFLEYVTYSNNGSPVNDFYVDD